MSLLVMGRLVVPEWLTLVGVAVFAVGIVLAAWMANRR
jgi:type IV secretory pathway TrbD component